MHPPGWFYILTSQKFLGPKVSFRVNMGMLLCLSTTGKCWWLVPSRQPAHSFVCGCVPLQEQRRVTLVTLAAVVVFVIVGTINLTGVVNRQQLW